MLTVMRCDPGRDVLGSGCVVWRTIALGLLPVRTGKALTSRWLRVI
jgi:hypothetical protein